MFDARTPLLDPEADRQPRRSGFLRVLPGAPPPHYPQGRDIATCNPAGGMEGSLLTPVEPREWPLWEDGHRLQLCGVSVGCGSIAASALGAPAFIVSVFTDRIAATR